MLPLVTTSVTLSRPSAGVDPYEAQGYATTVSGVPGTVSQSGQTGRAVGGAQDVEDAFALLAEGTDVRAGDRLVDDTSGETWDVGTVRARYELGLGHVRCGLRRSSGASDG